VDVDGEERDIEFLPTTENETNVRQRHRSRSSLSNRAAGARNRGGIGRIVRDFWAE
jgi:hypothetical protein